MASTVDPNEMSNFEGLSRIWWDEGGTLSMLHGMNELRIPFIVDGLNSVGVVKKENVDTSQPLRDLLILDAGCGGGFLSEPLVKLGARVVGIDPSADLIEVAKHHAASDPSLSNLEYKCETAEEHVVKNFEKYDVIIASEVVDHVSDSKWFLESCVKCLKPGGSIFVTTKNRTTAAWLLMMVYYEYITRKLRRGSHIYERFLTPEETQKILEDFNCHTTTTCGFFYNLITGKWSRSLSKSLFYALHAVKAGT